MVKKILFSIPNFDTAGSGKALLNLAKGLNPNEFEPHIMCLHDRGVLFKEVIDSGIPFHLIPYLSQARPITRLLKQSWQTSRKLKQVKPDLIHSFNYSADYTEAMASFMAGIPWIYTKKSMSWGGSSANSWKLRTRLASHIIVQNSDMQSQFFPGSEKTTLIPRGVDCDRYKPEPASEATFRRMQTTPEKRVLIAVANFVPVKGIELLIGAFSRIASKFPNWILWLVGDDDNEYGQQLHQLVRESGMTDTIRFSGKQGDVRPFLHCAELFVLPTKDEGRKEGSPVALLEAMANGKVVIGSAIPGIKDQLRLFPEHMIQAGNEFALAEKLIRFMAEPKDVLKSKGQEFRTHAMTQYPIQLEIERHESFYHRLLNR